MTEVTVKIQIKIPPIIGIIILSMLMGAACSSNMLSSDGDQTNNQTSSVRITQEINSALSEVIPVKADRSHPASMVAFEGNVFVASTKPIVDHWHQAGWQIARQSLTVEVKQVPVDCTLYRHLGVEDQWIGSCSGYIFIPRDGASHIAVMHTQLDGSSNLVQIAPYPDSHGP
jgi:hypothetical protein